MAFYIADRDIGTLRRWGERHGHKTASAALRALLGVVADLEAKALAQAGAPSVTEGHDG